MTIQHLQDGVSYIAPNGLQTDYQAIISIVFSPVDDAGVLQPALIYTQTVTGGTSQDNLVQLYQEVRPTITDAVLIAYAQGTPTPYVPPTPPPVLPAP